MTEFASKTPDRNNHKETIKTVSCFDDTRNSIHSGAKWFYEANKNNPEKIKDLKTFLWFQEEDRQNVEKKYNTKKTEITKETNTNLDKEKKVQYLSNLIYKKLWINPKLEQNKDDSMKFVKWVVDWLILNNIEAIEDLLSKSKDELISILDNLTNPDVIYELLKEIISSLWDILNSFTKPYEWWLAIWWLWLWIFSKTMNGLKIAEKVWKIDNLYDSKEYLLKSDKTLDKILKKVDKSHVLWEWDNWIVIYHPDDDKLVIKISKEWKYVDDIQKEFDNHTAFYEKYLEWKDKIESNVIIPHIEKPDNSTRWYFFIEKIEWQNLYTKFHLNLHKDKLLEKYDIDTLSWLNDKEFIEVLREEKLPYAVPTMNFWDVWMWWWWTKLSVDLMLYTEKFKKDNLPKAIEYFKSQNLEHTDFHSWNIMLDKNWKDIYIIDFWNINK